MAKENKSATQKGKSPKNDERIIAWATPTELLLSWHPVKLEPENVVA